MPTRPPRSALSKLLLDRLFEQCNWAHEVWTLRRAMFDGNRRKRTLDRGPHTYFLYHLQNILTEYVTIQIAKLHDQAVVAGRVSLTLDYVVEYGGFDVPTKKKLARIRATLDKLGSILRQPRNKLIAHNDLAAVMQDAPLGEFAAGMDTRYFQSLQRFLKAAYVGAIGEPCADFSTFSKSDAAGVIRALAADTRPEPRRRRRAG